MSDGSIPAEDPAAVRLALADVVRDYGPAALDDARLIGRMLPDLLSGAQRATALVTAAAHASVGRQLRERIGVGMQPALAINDVGAALSATSLLQMPACVWIVGEYAVALGMVSPAEIIRPVPTSAPPAPYQAQPAAPVSGSPAPVWSPQPSPQSAPPGYQPPHPGYSPAPAPAYPPAGYAPQPAGYVPQPAYPPAGYAPPGYPAPQYVAVPVGYGAPGRAPAAPVPGGGYRVVASVLFYVLAIGALIGFDVHNPSVGSPTVWVLCAAIFALTGVYLSTRVAGMMIAVLVAVGLGALRYIVLPGIADLDDTSSSSSLNYRSAFAEHWVVLVISGVVALAVVLAAIGESGPASERVVDAAGGRMRRPAVVTTAGWTWFVLTFYELFLDYHYYDLDPFVCLLPALGIALWRGSRGGHILGFVVVGLTLLRDGQVLYDLHKYSGEDFSEIRQYLVIEMVLLVAAGVAMWVAANQAYFRSPPGAPMAYQYPPGAQPAAAQVWQHVPTQAAPDGQPPAPPPPTAVG